MRTPKDFKEMTSSFVEMDKRFLLVNWLFFFFFEHGY